MNWMLNKGKSARYNILSSGDNSPDKEISKTTSRDSANSMTDRESIVGLLYKFTPTNTVQVKCTHKKIMHNLCVFANKTFHSR